MSNKLEILIIGKIPPPIGGVSIHVKRLLESLSKTEWRYSFYDINQFSFFTLVENIKRSELIHLHSSRPLFRLLVSIICKLLGKNLISTIHGELGRFKLLNNFFDFLGLYLSDYPIVLNKNSYNIGYQYNSNTKLISAFIPPQTSCQLNREITFKINGLRKNYSKIFCTNASNLSFDKKGNEIYNILMLLNIFKSFKAYGLIISDPSKSYKLFFEQRRIMIPKNILILTEEHSFTEVIKSTEVFIRATTTDGDSLSVKEALFLGKKVIATDCVNRPKGVILYDGSKKQLENILRHELTPNVSYSRVENGFIQLNSFYHQIKSSLHK